MKDILQRVKEFQYTSLEYADISDISDSQVCVNNNHSLFLYSKSEGKATIDWGTSSKEEFFHGLEEAIAIISQNKSIKKIYIEFIPEDYVSEMENRGFIIVSEWVDFWNNNLNTIDVEQPNSLVIRRISENEYKEASEITKSCKGYSRGFRGESPQWIREWNESENSCIFIAEMNKKIIGICCVNLYGFESEKGIVLWLREIAVNPNYHSQKVGLNLAVHGINWGKENGAVRSFLACDAENKYAIKLYEGLGYKRKLNRGQINMEKIIEV